MKTDRAMMLWQRFKDIYAQKWTSLFQGPEAIESWAVSWSTIECTADDMRYAIDRMIVEFPQWPPTMGEFKALLGSRPKPQLPAPKIERTEPTPEQAAELAKVAKVVAPPSFPWWTPERVKNPQQVDFIVRQAARFGDISPAGRFLAQCKAAGVIDENNRLARPKVAA